MPEFLALNWDHRQLIGVKAEIEQGGLRATKCFSMPLPDGFDLSAQPQQAGRWLGDELRRLGIQCENVMVSLPRGQAVVRHLELPNAPDEELPDLVRLQAATKSSVALDRLLLDFLPLPPRPDNTGRDVLMATVSREIVDGICHFLEAAELKPISIGITSLAATEIAVRIEQRRGANSNETSLLVARHQDRVEISLIQQRHLLFTHSRQLHGETDDQNIQSILVEVSRSVVAMQRQLESHSIRRAWVVGAKEENRSLCTALAERLNCDVETLDPIADFDLDSNRIPTDHESFVGPVGMLLSAAEGTVEAIDFLNPRKPVVKPDERKRKMVMGGAGLAVAALLWIGGSLFYISRLETEIGRLQSRKADLDLIVRNGKPVLESAATVDGWLNQGLNWLERMQQLNRVLPRSDRILLSDYRFSRATTHAGGSIRATGTAVSRDEVESLNERLDQQNYRVLPHEITHDGKEPRFSFGFEMDIEVTAAQTPANSEKSGNIKSQPQSATADK